MTDFDSYVDRCLYKSESKIRKLCLPLEESLEIPIFSYFKLDNQGNFCLVSNAFKELEYFFGNHLYKNDPYSYSPKFFQKVYKIIQQTSDKDSQYQLKDNFHVDHFFQMLYKFDDHIEGFIFIQKNKSYKDCLHFFNKIYLLEKYVHYFKAEAKSIIRLILEQGYNMKIALGNAFEAPPPIHQLSTQPSGKYSQFLKQIDLFTPRENQCIDLYKQGHSAQTTAAKLGLSQRTVEHYLDSARIKLGFQSKREFLEI